LEYEIANFLISPSYVSLESALSYHGIITQFPYQITSVTIKKTREIKIGQKIYSFAKLKKPYFNDFIRQDNFLISSKQKTIFDYFYFAYRGLRTLNLLDEIDEKVIKNKKLKRYLKEKARGGFKRFLFKNRLI